MTSVVLCSIPVFTPPSKLMKHMFLPSDLDLRELGTELLGSSPKVTQLGSNGARIRFQTMSLQSP